MVEEEVPPSSKNEVPGNWIFFRVLIQKIMGWGGNLELLELFFVGVLQKVPPLFMVQKFVNQLMVQGVTRLIPDEMANNLGTQEPEVTDRIQNLVAYKFVFKPQAVRIHHTLVVDYHRVLLMRRRL